jgi:hypothetical protein
VIDAVINSLTTKKTFLATKGAHDILTISTGLRNLNKNKSFLSITSFRTKHVAMPTTSNGKANTEARTEKKASVVRKKGACSLSYRIFLKNCNP